MGHPRGMADQRLHSAKTFTQHEEAAARDERRYRLGRAVEFERQHAAETSHLLLRHLVARVIGQPWIVDACHRRVRRERRRDPAGVFGVPLHAQFERLQSAQGEPAIQWGGHGADRVLQELDRLEYGGVAREHGALDQVGMAGQVFGHAVHHQVGAQGERLLEHRRGEGVVDHHQGALRMRQFRDRPDVRHQQARIGRRLQPHQPRRRGHRRGHGLKVRGVDRRDRQVKPREHAREQPIGAAVDVKRHNHFVVRPQVRMQDRVLRRQARGEHRAVPHAFEFGEHLFEPLTGGIVRPRVVKAQVDARLFLLERRGLVDRRHQGPGRRVTGLGRVNGTSGKAHLCRHDPYLSPSWGGS